MIYAKDMHIYDNHIDNFNYEYNLAKDKKYKLPYMYQHFFRRGKFIIDGNIEDVYLSNWLFKPRNIDNKRIIVSIMEFPKNYVMRITQEGVGPIGKSKWYEELDYIPNWDEIEKIVRRDF